jgi:hypothetical protein
MKWYHLKNYEINKILWEKSILSATNGNLYAYSWYLDIVSPEWEVIVSDNYDFIMPLTVKKIFHFKILQQPIFAQQLGVYVQHISLINKFKEITEYLIKTFPYINIQLNKYISPDLIDKNANTNILTKINYELDLIPSYEYLWKKFNENTRRNIIKSRKEKIYIKINHLSTETFVNFIRRNLNEKVRNLKEKEYQKITEIVSFTRKNNISKLYSVHNSDGGVIAASLFVFSHRRAYYLFASSNTEGKNKRAMFLLLDEFIKNYSENNIILDFEGTMIPGLARFYSGFGATPTNYTNWIFNKLPFYLRLFKK